MRRNRPPVPTIDAQFVSDAAALRPRPPAQEIAEMWLDNVGYEAPTESDWNAAVREVSDLVDYYLY